MKHKLKSASEVQSQNGKSENIARFPPCPPISREAGFCLIAEAPIFRLGLRDAGQTPDRANASKISARMLISDRRGTTGSSPTKEFTKRFEDTTGQGECLLRCSLELLSKRPLLSAVHLARSSRHLIGGQIDVIRGPGGHASRRGKLIRD